MGASEKAVAAVMETLRPVLRDHEPVLLDKRPWCMCGHKSETPALRERHLLEVLAVAAADAAVDTDRPSIQAETLRSAAKMIRARKTAGNADIGPNGRALERRAIANALSVEAWAITDGADRTEAQS